MIGLRVSKEPIGEVFIWVVAAQYFEGGLGLRSWIGVVTSQTASSFRGRAGRPLGLRRSVIFGRQWTMSGLLSVALPALPRTSGL